MEDENFEDGGGYEEEQEEVEEEVEIFFRDPVQLVEELIGNPDFNHPDIMAYEPVELYSGPTEEEMAREYTEASTGEWWNKLQVFIHSLRCLTLENTNSLMMRPESATRWRDCSSYHSIIRQNTIIDIRR